MGKKEVLLELVVQLFDFDQEVPTGQDYGLADFLAYLQPKYSDSQEFRDVSGPEEQALQENRNIETEIAVQFLFLYRYSVLYGRKALKNSEIRSLDEFSFLIVLMTHTHLSKTDLINKLIMEKTSGTEVIKRLLRRELIQEFRNPADKRSVLVSVTDRGRELVRELLPRMQLLSQVVAGNLEPSELRSLSYLLRKLDHHHNGHFLHRRDADLEELLSSPAAGKKEKGEKKKSS